MKKNQTKIQRTKRFANDRKFCIHSWCLDTRPILGFIKNTIGHVTEEQVSQAWVTFPVVSMAIEHRSVVN